MISLLENLKTPVKSQFLPSNDVLEASLKTYDVGSIVLFMAHCLTGLLLKE